MITGSCLCGATRYELRAPFDEMHNCHCSRCRKAHGTPFATYARVAKESLRLVAGADRLGRFRSSPPVARSFCAECGSSLFFEFDPLPDAIWVAVGSVDGDPGLRPQAHIFVGSQAPWHTIEDDLPQFPEYPPQD